MKKITIITLADAIYFDYILCMVRSAHRHFYSASIYSVLVNLDDEKAKILKKSHHDIEVANEHVLFSSDEEKGCYCTNRRAHLFKDLRRKIDGHLIWIDADSIFRKDCSEFRDFILSCELTMRAKFLDQGTFAAGVIGISDSEVCRKFIDDYYYAVEREKDWMSNQRNLNVMYDKYKDSINFKPLPNKYCDVWFSSEGVIWAAKSKKKKDKRYLKEMRLYQ